MDTKQTMPGNRAGFTRKFHIRYPDKLGQSMEFKFYVSFSTYDDGRCGEIFITGDKADPTLKGVLDGFAKLVSIALQHGASLPSITSKLRHDQFPPSGFTGDEDFKSCTSMFDLIAQYLDYRFPAPDYKLCPDPKGHKALADREQPCSECERLYKTKE